MLLNDSIWERVLVLKEIKAIEYLLYECYGTNIPEKVLKDTIDILNDLREKYGSRVHLKVPPPLITADTYNM